MNSLNRWLDAKDDRCDPTEQISQLGIWIPKKNGPGGLCNLSLYLALDSPVYLSYDVTMYVSTWYLYL